MAEHSVTFIGNATTIIRYGSFTLLTDPNFLRRGQRAYLGYGLTSRRLKDPAILVEEPPALDGVVLSHLHDDHWVGVAEQHLDHALPIITTTSGGGPAASARVPAGEQAAQHLAAHGAPQGRRPVGRGETRVSTRPFAPPTY